MAESKFKSFKSQLGSVLVMPESMADEYSYELKVPRDRVAVLIGKGGETKKQLEHLTSTRMDVDSTEGDVTITGTDALSLYTAREVVRAIARGFSPETALLLLKQDYALEVINISSYAKTQNDFVRLRGRVIGEEGKSRRIIEELTGVFLSVFGKTVALIGSYDGLNIARKAVDMLLSGTLHATVYRYLEKHHKFLKRGEWSEPV